MKNKFNPIPAKDIIIDRSQSALYVEMNLKNLTIRSVLNSDHENCITLLADYAVMRTYGVGISVSREESLARIASWMNSWANHDPLTMYSIIERKTNEFVGVIKVWSEGAGKVEIAYIISKAQQGKGYGKEAAAGMLESLLPVLMIHGYKAESASFKEIQATSLPDNFRSIKILKRIGFKEQGVVHKHGAPRRFFNLSALSQRNRYLNFFNQSQLKEYENKYLERVNESADVKAEEMAAFFKK